MLQQAITLKVADAVKAGDLTAAKAWRCELSLPRGVSAVEGALLLEQLGSQPDKRGDAARLLTREAITWQTTLVRHLLDDVARSAAGHDPMPGRLRERLAEANTLATLPQSLIDSAGLQSLPPVDRTQRDAQLQTVYAANWPDLPAAYKPLQKTIESSLPSLLTDKETHPPRAAAAEARHAHPARVPERHTRRQNHRRARIPRGRRVHRAGPAVARRTRADLAGRIG